jgi:uncharacterized protein
VTDGAEMTDHAPALPTTIAGDALIIAVRATPKASRSAIKSVVTMPDGSTALSVAVAAPPVDGEANATLTAFLAKSLGVSKGAAVIEGGATGRTKRVRITLNTGKGAGGAELAARLSAILSSLPPPR